MSSVGSTQVKLVTASGKSLRAEWKIDCSVLRLHLLAIASSTARCESAFGAAVCVTDRSFRGEMCSQPNDIRRSQKGCASNQFRAVLRMASLPA